MEELTIFPLAGVSIKVQLWQPVCHSLFNGMACQIATYLGSDYEELKRLMIIGPLTQDSLTTARKDILE